MSQAEDKWTSDMVVALLRQRYSSEKGQWVCATEVHEGTGHNTGRRADFIAMNCWPSSGYTIEGIEIKVSRSDWQSELKQPSKADAIGRYCARWWVAAPKGIIKAEELPTGWGLLEATKNGMRIVEGAKTRTPEPLSNAFVASFLRNAAQGGVTISELNAAESRGFKRGRESAESQAERELRRLQAAAESNEKTLELVRLFEKETGIRVTNDGFLWRQVRLPSRDAVRFIQEGGLDAQKAEIAGIVEQLTRATKYLGDILTSKEEPTRNEEPA